MTTTYLIAERVRRGELLQLGPDHRLRRARPAIPGIFGLAPADLEPGDRVRASRPSLPPDAPASCPA